MGNRLRFHLDDFPVPSLIADFSNGQSLQRRRESGEGGPFSRDEAAELLATGRTTGANQSALDLLQVSSLEELIAFRRAFRAEMIPWFQEALGSLGSGADSPWRETVVYRRDGEAIPVLGRARDISGPEHALTGILWSFIDISVLKAAEERARAAQRAAEEANQSKSRFLAMMSHEIRTPLNGVLGMTQLLLQKSLPPAATDMVRVISQSGEALLAILNDLLDLAKIDAGQLTFELVEFDVNAMALGARNTFTALAQKKGVSFNLEVSPAAAGAWLGDPTRLRQILYNLISNSLKFTERGQILVSLTIADSILTIKVRDTGIGIAPDRMAALFDPFVQADRTITRKYGGTGLGLTICRELAELMGGEISVESVLGEGSVFTANVPVNRVTGSDVAIAPSRPVEAPELARSWNLKLLIADDNQVNQLILQTMLLPMGFELTTVDDGRAALDALKQDAFDIVLMDVQMPVMDGISAVREYREFEKEACRPPIPVIAVTANVMAHQVTEYEEAGMSGMVEKPIQFAALVAEIGRLLDGRS